MAIRSTVTTMGPRYPAAFRKATQRANRWAADKYVELVTEQMAKGQAPDGTTQEPNTIPTRDAKLAKRGRSVPLVDEGILSTGSKWTVSEAEESVSVGPPAERGSDVIKGLIKNGYNLRGFPPKLKRLYPARLEAEILEAQRIAGTRTRRFG